MKELYSRILPPLLHREKFVCLLCDGHFTLSQSFGINLLIIQENKKRREQEERIAKRKAEMAKRETLPRAKKKGAPPPEEECVIDTLLTEIRHVLNVSLTPFLQKSGMY